MAIVPHVYVAIETRDQETRDQHQRVVSRSPISNLRSPISNLRSLAYRNRLERPERLGRKIDIDIGQQLGLGGQWAGFGELDRGFDLLLRLRIDGCQLGIAQG